MEREAERDTAIETDRHLDNQGQRKSGERQSVILFLSYRCDRFQIGSKSPE